ncbi:hypothetical protein [Hydrogenophaga sp.]|uniref:hypothetical protein n=1 Tax=Hydrogenophaga sp. TaxID=1904254 RepID=UPI00262D722D|nr:hypothetical protein [Hydrogenophaga sp.]MCW5652115.1 hypothetical protein [Hydrogenophaga sp.]
MNNSFARLIDGMCATLRAEVLSRLDDEFARGQVYGVINLLNTFKTRADWSPEWLALQVKAQSEALAQASAALQTVAQGAPLPAAREWPVPVPAAELLARRDQGNREIGTLMNWVADHRASLPEAAAQEAERALRQAMRTEIELELKYSPRPLFSEMSSGREDPAV